MGDISVVSEPGSGTAMSFSVAFGAAEPEESPVTGRDSFFAPSLDRLSVLMAEDDHFSAMLGTKLLRTFGATVRHVQNGRQALDALEKERFDLALMDVQMPVMDGVEVATRIRRGEAGEGVRNIPIIAMTSYAMDGDREKFLRAGMNAYVSKPVDIKKLMSAITEMLGQEAGKRSGAAKDSH